MTLRGFTSRSIWTDRIAGGAKARYPGGSPSLRMGTVRSLRKGVDVQCEEGYPGGITPGLPTWIELWMANTLPPL
jgi:hypothetical protein